jgi:hypothetical protein
MGVNKYQNSTVSKKKQLKVIRLDEFCVARMHIVLAAVNPAFLILLQVRPILVTQCARRMRPSQQSITLKLLNVARIGI